MSRFEYITKAAGTLLVCASLAACQCRLGVTSITARIQEGKQYCTVVHFPKTWDLPFGYAVASRGVYRLSRAGDAFFFSLRNPFTGREIPIEQKYRIDLMHLGEIRPATEGEWASGKEIELRRATGAVKLQGAEPQTHPVERDDRTLVLIVVNQFPNDR